MYRTDLAHIQHAGFAGFSNGTALGLLAILRGARIRSGHVVDLGCGAGEWLRLLTSRGYRATGIEQSRSLARIAGVTAPQATIQVGSAYSTPIPACDAVTALGEVLSYLPAPPLGTLFKRVARALPPNGLFLFDLMVRTTSRAQYRSWHAGSDWVLCLEVRSTATRLTRDITTFRRVGRGYRRRRETHRVRLVDAETVIRDLRRAGFSVTTARRYGRYRLAPGRLAFIARRERSTP